MTSRPIRAGYLLTLLAVVVSAVLMTLLPAGNRISASLYDSLLPSSEDALETRVVVVDIDEQSLAQLGRWPWPRQTTADLLAAIQQHRPAIIGLDILFPEPQSPQQDTALKAQLMADNLVAVVTFAKPQWQGEHAVSPQQIGLSPSLASDTTLAHITPLYDSDHSIRRLYPEICSAEPNGQQHCNRTLAAAMLERLILQDSQLLPSNSLLDNPRWCIGPYCQYRNNQGELLIPYGQTRSALHLPAWQVMTGEHADKLAGALVILGTSAVGLGDNVLTPLAANTPGVDIHARLLAGWLDSASWQTLPHSQRWQLLLIALIALAAFAWTSKLNPNGLWLISSVALLAALTPYLLLYSGRWLDPLPSNFAFITSALALLVALSLQARHSRQQLTRAFSRYVPPTVLKQLLAGAGENPLAPRRAEITVLFADIKGFTSLGEQLPPEKLALLTNRLFTELTDEVHSHQGTLDKFMGDCLMAFWGAPLAQHNHSQLALDCALALQQRLDNLEQWLEQQQLPPIALSIALESGPVTVGNLGARQRRAYTVIGHPVNLAAHLQTMTKALERDLLLGPGISQQLSGYRLESLGEIELKGLSAPQHIYSPIKAAKA